MTDVTVTVSEIEGWDDIDYSLQLFEGRSSFTVDVLLKASYGDKRFESMSKGIVVADDRVVARMVLLLARRVAIQLGIPQPLNCDVEIDYADFIDDEEGDDDDE